MKLAIAAALIVPALLEAQTGIAVPELLGVENALKSISQKYQLPGVSFAVARNGKLVYARGFGLADRENNRMVQPDSLFRAGSISKTFTAISLLKLQEQGKLSLDDKVFDILSEYQDAIADPRLRTVTVRQLLHHTAGWDSLVSGDPLFPAYEDLLALGGAATFPPVAADVIRFWLAQPLDHDPGSVFNYSNFGFLLAGQVIEKVTGRSYAETVRGLVLEPLGISHMRLGRSLDTQMAPTEVRYYDVLSRTAFSIFSATPQQAAEPYGTFSMDLIHSAGAWIASAPELVRVLASLQDLLTPASLQQFLERPAGLDNSSPVWYGLGILIQDAGGLNLVHGGDLPGSLGVFASFPNGTQIAFLTNTDPGAEDPAAQAAFQTDLFNALLPALGSVTQWPAATTDQFPGFVSPLGTVPPLSLDAIVSAASMVPGPVSPGEVLALTGTGIGTAANIWFDNTPVAQFASGAGADVVKLISPFDLAGKTDVSITVGNAAGNWAAPVVLPVVAAQPAAFLNGSVALALNEDGSLHAETNPAARGSLVVIYASGLGVLTSAVTDGTIATTATPPPAQTPVILLGGSPATVEYAGPVPGLPYGIYQIGIRIPAGVRVGIQPLTIQSGSATSPAGAALAIR